MKKHKLSLLLVSFVSILAIGCASVPKPIGNEYSHTKIKFPDKNMIKTINKGDIAFLHYDYESKFTYTTDDEVSTRIVFDKVFVPKGASLTKSTLEGKDVFCYNSTRPICFNGNSDKQYLNKVSMAPGAVWFSKDLSPPIKYITTETYRKKSAPTKIEIIFDGYNQNYLSFIYKEFTDQSLLPSLIQPVLVEVSNAPVIISVKNIKIEVTQYADKTLTYRVLD